MDDVKKTKAYTVVLDCDNFDLTVFFAKQCCIAGMDVFVANGLGCESGLDMENDNLIEQCKMKQKYIIYITSANPEAFAKVYGRILDDINAAGDSLSGYCYEAKYLCSSPEAPNNLDSDPWAKIKKQGRSGSAKSLYLDDEVCKYLNDLSARYNIKASQIANSIIREYMIQHL